MWANPSQSLILWLAGLPNNVNAQILKVPGIQVRALKSNGWDPEIRSGTQMQTLMKLGDLDGYILWDDLTAEANLPPVWGDCFLLAWRSTDGLAWYSSLAGPHSSAPEATPTASLSFQNPYQVSYSHRPNSIKQIVTLAEVQRSPKGIKWSPSF